MFFNLNFLKRNLCCLSDALGLTDSRPSSFQYVAGQNAPSQEAIRKEKEREMEEELQLQAKLVG